MVQEIAVDRDLDALDVEGGDGEPFGVGMVGRFARDPAAEEDDVGHDFRPLAGEGIGGQADRPEEVGLLGERLPHSSVLLVEREMARDQGQDPAGLQGVEGLGEEEVMQGELLAVIVEANVGEGDVADDRIDPVRGQAGPLEVLDADVGLRVQGSGDAAGDLVQLDADEAEVAGGVAEEVAGAAARLQDGGPVRDPEAVQGPEHRADDGG